jgi:hypothetical protein
MGGPVVKKKEKGEIERQKREKEGRTYGRI